VCTPVFYDPTFTESIETEPPSTPSRGKVSGSDEVRVPALAATISRMICSAVDPAVDRIYKPEASSDEDPKLD